jgi:hypothetical protein
MKFLWSFVEGYQRRRLLQRVASAIDNFFAIAVSSSLGVDTSPAKKSELQAIFEREAHRLIDGGADVIVSTGGIPMMLFGKEP